MVTPSRRRFAGVLAHHDGQLVLLRESHPTWGGEFWNMPSGVVEPHETPAEGAARELAEETGLAVQPSDLRLRTTASVLVDGHESWAWNFDVDVADPTVRVHDPDGHVREARWFPVVEAVDRLRRLPYRPLAEPAIATLTGPSTATTNWTFNSADADPQVSWADE